MSGNARFFKDSNNKVVAAFDSDISLGSGSKSYNWLDDKTYYADSIYKSTEQYYVERLYHGSNIVLDAPYGIKKLKTYGELGIGNSGSYMECAWDPSKGSVTGTAINSAAQSPTCYLIDNSFVVSPSSAKSGDTRTYTSLKLVATPKDGMKFVGWDYYWGLGIRKVYSTNSTITINGGDIPGFNDANSHPDFKANFEDARTGESFTYTYNGNGGTPARASDTATYPNEVTLPSASRYGYSLKGWYTEPAAGSLVGVAGASVKVWPTRTVYAQWTGNSYSVAFNANGGTGTMTTQTGFVYGTAKALSANAFSRANHTFAGWALTSGGPVAYTDKQSVSNLTAQAGATVTLYAVWSVNKYNLTLTVGTGISAIYYKVNGETAYTSTASTKTVPVTYNTQWSVYATQKSGYTYSETSSSNPKTGTMGASGASFSATGTANSYTLTLNSHGATTAGTTAVYYTFDTAKYYSNSGHTSQITSITKPTNGGFQFGGYYTAEGGGGTQYVNSSGAFVNSPHSSLYANTTLHAKWIPNTYKIRVSNGTTYSEETAYYGTPKEIRAPGARAHYRFAGWKVTSGLDASSAVWGKTSAACTTRLTSASTVIENGTTGSVYVDKLTQSNGETVTMTAQWERISYTVTVDNSTNKGRFDISSSAPDATYTDGVLTFTALAGDSYSVTATFRFDSLATSWWIIPASVNGHAFSRENLGSGAPAVFSASHTFGDSEIALSWTIRTRSVGVSISNPRASDVPLPTISFGDDDTDGTSVKIVAGTYTGVKFSQWDSLSPSGVTPIPDLNHSTVTLSGISQNTTSIRAVYELARMDCNVEMDTKSLAATQSFSSQNWVWVKSGNPSSSSEWGHSVANVAYGQPVTYKFEKQTPETAPDYTFDGWYDAKGNRVSTELTYTITSVTSEISLYAKMRVNVTLVKSIVQPSGASAITANLVLNHVEYTGASCYTSVVIGESVPVGVVLGSGAFFANWYDSADREFANPLPLTMNDELEVDDKKSITARIINQQSVYYVAIYARDMTGPTAVISTTVGQLEVFGESVTVIQKSQYQADTGTTALGDGVFAQVRGTQVVGLGAVKIGSLDFLRFKGRKLSGGTEDVISRSASARYKVVQSYVFFAEFGSPDPSRIRATLASADEREKGFVEVGGAAIDVSGDGIYSEGTFTVGDTARVIAHPGNGWLFAGWYASPSFTGSPVSVEAYYDFVAPNGGKTLYAKFEADDGASLHKWEGSSERMLAKWRSKRYVLNKPSNLTSVRVDAEGYFPKNLLRLILKSFSSPSPDEPARDTIDFSTDGSRIRNQDMRRLPTKRPERYFQVEVQNDAEVDAIFLGTSGGELAV